MYIMTTIFYFIWFIISVMFMSNITDMIVNNLNPPSKIKYVVSIKAMFSFIIFISFLVIGFFSNNWLMFILFSIYYFIWWVILKFIDNVKIMHFILLLSIYIFSLFISLNHFYFKYDLECLIKQLFYGI